MFYTYVWLRTDGTPYYVGKGKGDRAYTNESHRVHRPEQRDRIVIYPAQSEAEAFETEIDLIWYYGRKDLGTGCLRNLTDGGENPPKSRKGRHRLSPIWNKGKTGIYSEEALQKMSKASSSRVHTFSEEHRRNLSKSRIGMKFTEEHKQHLKEARQRVLRRTHGN